MSRRFLRAIVVGLLAAAVTGALTAAGALDGFERTLLDQRYEERGTHPAPDVVVVGIDEDTATAYDFPFHRIRRSVHARVIEALLAAGARSVAYDVQFSDPSERPDDLALLRAAADPRVVLGTAEFFARGVPALIGERYRERHSGRVGSVLLLIDPDGVWRRMETRPQGFPALSVLAARGDLHADEHPIDYAGPPGHVEEISFLDVVKDHFDPAAVRGRIVVVGATAITLKDSYPTPAGEGLMPGAEIHANAIQTVLDGYPLHDAPSWAAVLLVLAAALYAPLVTVRGAPARAIGWALLAGVSGVFVLLLLGGVFAFHHGLILPLAPPLLALALGTTGAVALTYGVEVRQRRRLRMTFERFVAPDVATQLLPADGSAPRLESQRVEATVLFCDLRGFTTFAEQLDAEQTITVLNRYLGLVSGAVFAHGGTVVSYQGDGVLAVFGAPLAQADHAARAYRTARQILDEELPRFNTWLAEERLADGPLDAGIGLNTGFVMSGLVGSDRRVEYAAVGDATNVAARLQALGRDIPGARLFVAARTAAALGEDGGGLRLHGDVELRGRSEPVTVYVAG